MKLTEAAMQKGIVSTAKQLGFMVYHTTYAIGSERGFPDLVICGHGRTFFWELKGPKPTIYPDQVEWIAALQDVGHDARFIHPADYDDALAILQAAYQEARQR